MNLLTLGSLVCNRRLDPENNNQSQKQTWQNQHDPPQNSLKECGFSGKIRCSVSKEWKEKREDREGPEDLSLWLQVSIAG